MIGGTHKIKDQLFTDTDQSWFGELLGLAIQPAQLKNAHEHYEKEQLKLKVIAKGNSINKKLTAQPESGCPSLFSL